MKQLLVDQLANATSLTSDATYTFTAEWHKPQVFTAVWTATTASVSLKLQYSLDNTNWFDFTTATSISNAGGSVAWQVGATADAKYWRVFPDFGTGTLTTFIAHVAYTSR